LRKSRQSFTESRASVLVIELPGYRLRTCVADEKAKRALEAYPKRLHGCDPVKEVDEIMSFGHVYTGFFEARL
jgi:hypothetical protein